MKQTEVIEPSRKQPFTAKSSSNVIAFTALTDPSIKDDRKFFSAKLPPRKPRNTDRREREYLTPTEVSTLIDAAKKIGRYGFRDAAVILLSYRHALRVGELVNLRWEHVDFNEGKLLVKRLKKGDASVHYLEGDEMRILRKLKQKSPGSPFIFTTERNTPISTRHIHTIVSRAGEVAGLTFPIHPHMLRHAKGYQLANKGYDTRLIQSISVIETYSTLSHIPSWALLDSRVSAWTDSQNCQINLECQYVSLFSQRTKRQFSSGPVTDLNRSVSSNSIFCIN